MCCIASIPFSPLLCLGAVVAKRIVPHLEMNHLALRLEADEMMKWYGLRHVAGGLFVKDDMKKNVFTVYQATNICGKCATINSYK